jgi:hypothetical protein
MYIPKIDLHFPIIDTATTVNITAQIKPAV